MKTVGEDCDFEDLPYLIVIFQILVPMVIGIPAVFFIPNVLQTEHLIDWKKEGWYDDARADDEPETTTDRLNEDNEDNDDGFAEDSRLEPHLL